MEGHSLIKGNLFQNMIKLLIPLFLTSIVAQVDNLINAIWITNLVGNEGVATIINCNPLIYVSTSISAGIAVATGVLVARLYTAKDEAALKTVIGTSYILNAIVCISLAIVMTKISPLLLQMLGTPIEVLDHAQNYFKVFMYGFSFNFVLTTLLGSMRSIGNSRTPLYIIGASSLMNIIVAPLLISGYGIFPNLGIEGAVWANVISSFISTILAIVYVTRKSKLLNIFVIKLRLDMTYCKYIFKIGIPVIIENFAISSIVMFEVYIANKSGVLGGSIYGAVSRIEQISIVLAGAYRMMASITVSQFIGGNMKESAKLVMKDGLKLTLIPTFLIILVVFVFPRQIVSIFITENQVIDQAVAYLILVGLAYILLPIRQLLNGFIVGTGHTSFTLFTVLLACLAEFILTTILMKIHIASLIVLGVGVLVWVLTEMIANTIFYLSGIWKKEVLRTI